MLPLAQELHVARVSADRHARHGGGACRPRAFEVEAVFKVNEGRPNIVDLVKTGKVDLIINTPLGRESFYDEKSIRRAAIRYKVPCITTLSAAQCRRARDSRAGRANTGSFAAAVAAFQESGRAATAFLGD